MQDSLCQPVSVDSSWRGLEKSSCSSGVRRGGCQNRTLDLQPSVLTSTVWGTVEPAGVFMRVSGLWWWVQGVNGTIIIHNCAFPPGKQIRENHGLFICATGWRGHDEPKAPKGIFCSGPGDKNWPLPGKFADSDSRGFSSSFQGASRTQSGCSQINTFSGCITPHSECRKTACTLTSTRQPVRTPAPSSR